MSLHQLPDKFREHAAAIEDEDPLDVYAIAAYRQCADELQAALPVWVKITDDPETWPTVGDWVMGSYGPRDYARSMMFIDHTKRRTYGRYWRPIIEGIDTPPEEQV